MVKREAEAKDAKDAKDAKEAKAPKCARNSPHTPHTPHTARRAAMDLLARREHSRLELSRKLGDRFEDRELVMALQGLADDGLQCDRRFAVSFSRERIRRAYGPRRIEAELRQRGVSPALIDEALLEVREDEGVSWASLARSAVERKFGTQAPQDIRERARRARFLYQRGFSTEDASEPD